MIHENFIVRTGAPKAHIYEGSSDGDGKFWASIWPICGQAGLPIGLPKSRAGDGRPVCKKCSAIAKKRGWV